MMSSNLPPFADEILATSFEGENPMIEEDSFEEIDENEFYIDYLAGLQLNQNNTKSCLYKYTGYDALEPGENENSEKDALDFVTTLYLFQSTVNSPRVRIKKGVVISQVYRQPMTSDYVARLTDDRIISVAKVPKRLLDEFIIACGYNPDKFEYKKRKL